MQLGYFTMPMHPPGSDITKTLHDDLDQIVFLDKLGFSEAWIGEHFTAEWENISAPDQFIAMALGRTENIILGTGVSCLPNHNPFVLAHRIAQLDHLAKGRFRWGVGSGGFPGDLDVFGYDPTGSEHRKMTAVTLDTILGLWRDPKPGLYETEWWRFTVPEIVEDYGQRFHIKPYQLPHPPIGVAGVSPNSETLRMAGERGFIPMSINTAPYTLIKGHWDAVVEGAGRSGSTPDRSMWRIARDIYVADTNDQAREDAIKGTLGRDWEGYFLKLLSRAKVLDHTKIDPDMLDSEVTLEYLLDNIWIVGTPDEVAAKLRDIYDYVGGFGTLLAMGHEWDPKEKWEHSMELLANEVLPQLSDLD